MRKRAAGSFLLSTGSAARAGNSLIFLSLASFRCLTRSVMISAITEANALMASANRLVSATSFMPCAYQNPTTRARHTRWNTLPHTQLCARRGASQRQFDSLKEGKTERGMYYSRRGRSLLHFYCTPSQNPIESMERVKGIEPSSQAWEARILPLNHTRFHSCLLLAEAVGGRKTRIAQEFSRAPAGATRIRPLPAGANLGVYLA